MSGLSVIFRRARDAAFIPAVWTNKLWHEYESYFSMKAVLDAGFSFAACGFDDSWQWDKYSTPSGGVIAVSIKEEWWAPVVTSLSIERVTDRIYGEIAYAFAEYHHHAVERYEVATENGMFGEHTTITVYVKD